MIDIDTVHAAIGFLLMFVCPVLFFVGSWFVDRSVRRRHGSASKRWFAFAIFSAAVLALFAILIRVPPSWQFSTSSDTVGAIGYLVGIGWLAIPLVAVPCIPIGLCGGVISHLLATRRSASAR
jgi:hypothetical protein